MMREEEAVSMTSRSSLNLLINTGVLEISYVLQYLFKNNKKLGGGGWTGLAPPPSQEKKKEKKREKKERERGER